MVEAGKPRKEAIAAFCGNTLVGWLLYRKGKRDFEILAVVVRPEMRRQGIASAMVGRLQDWAANYDLLDVITARVLEGDLANQLFFRKLGFRVKDAAHDDEEYKFRWEVKEYERG
jgi:RimJ/RimL family protein N-acetyltransferase